MFMIAFVSKCYVFREDWEGLKRSPSILRFFFFLSVFLSERSDVKRLPLFQQPSLLDSECACVFQSEGRLQNG